MNQPLTVALHLYLFSILKVPTEGFPFYQQDTPALALAAAKADPLPEASACAPAAAKAEHSMAGLEEKDEPREDAVALENEDP